MGIGAGIFLIAAGAILAFAIDRDQVDFINIQVVGWILMLVGLLGLILTTVIWAPRRRAVVRERRTYDDRTLVERPVERQVVDRPVDQVYEERIYDDRP